MKRYKESDYIIESFDEFMANRFDGNINEDIELAAIGAGAIAHKLYETNQVISEDTYLLSYMTEYQIEECVDAFYNFVDVYGHQPDFINECIDAFLEISDVIWENYEGYITEGYDEDDLSVIEEDASIIASVAEDINNNAQKPSFWQRHKGKILGGAAIAAGGALAYNKNLGGVRDKVDKGRAMLRGGWAGAKSGATEKGEQFTRVKAALAQRNAKPTNTPPTEQPKIEPPKPPSTQTPPKKSNKPKANEVATNIQPTNDVTPPKKPRKSNKPKANEVAKTVAQTNFEKTNGG